MAAGSMGSSKSKQKKEPPLHILIEESHQARKWQLGAADAEIKVPSVENRELKGSPI